jgi:FPC/CPF motif-containing protein YcgG
MNNRTIELQEKYINFILNKNFPCIGAKAALGKKQLHCIVAGNMACPADDKAILDFLYDFTDKYRLSPGHFHSAAILFDGPEILSEEIFETLLWQRLQALADLDAARFGYDKRVSPDTASPDFSFSLKEEAFFILGMHPFSSRAARRFDHPALIFNPHAQFEEMKKTNKYYMIQQAVRKRDLVFSGSINPMLNDHGKSPETLQYSGKNYKEPLQCPLKIRHAIN